MSIYTALSGAIQQSQKLDTLANNIANANTTAFKKDQQIFREKLVRASSLDQVLEIPSISISELEKSSSNGEDKKQVSLLETYTHFDQGALKPTHQKMDFAIEGRGFFEVLTPNGLRLTRNGNLHIDSLGRLVSQSGFPVLSVNQNQTESLPINQRVIQVQPGNLFISEQGDIFSRNEFLGKISVVDLEDLKVLKKEGHSLYKLPVGGESLLKPSSSFRVLQGFTEESNVNLVEEMTDLIKTTRTFESNKELIKAFDKMQEKLISSAL